LASKEQMLAYLLVSLAKCMIGRFSPSDVASSIQRSDAASKKQMLKTDAY